MRVPKLRLLKGRLNSLTDSGCQKMRSLSTAHTSGCIQWNVLEELSYLAQPPTCGVLRKGHGFLVHLEKGATTFALSRRKGRLGFKTNQADGSPTEIILSPKSNLSTEVASAVLVEPG